MAFTGEIPLKKSRTVSLNNPRFSIITVCFNAGRTIEQTLRSVCSQTYPDIEYIVLDGASNDNTLEIIGRYNDQITIFRSEKDKGLYDALNKGLALATGDIIGILHADDFYPGENVISHIATLFNAHPNAGAVSSSVQIFRNDNFEQVYRTYDATRFKPWQFRIGIQPPHPGFFITKEALEKVGNYDTAFRISGDFDWLLRVIRINRIQTVYTDFVSVCMRDGGMSSSGFASKKLMNTEDLASLKQHGIYSNMAFIYFKYFIKIFQVEWKSFLAKKHE